MTTDYNKPERHRLQRLHTRIEKALDELSRGAGEMRPIRFKGIRDRLATIMAQLEQISGNIEDGLGAKQSDLLSGRQGELPGGQPSPYADESDPEPIEVIENTGRKRA